MDRWVLDSQVHVWLPESADRPWPEGGAELARRHGTEALTGERLLCAMDAAGVDAALLTPPSFEGFRNDYALGLAHDHAQRLRVMARVDLRGDATDVERALLELDADPFVAGVRLVFLDIPGGAGPLRASAPAFWATAEGLGLPVMLAAPGQTANIGPIAQRHPRLQIAVDHLGLSGRTFDDDVRPEIDELLALAELPNVAVKASCLPSYSKVGYPHPAILGAVLKVIERFGAQRVFWGSDVTRLPPSATYRSALDMVATMLGLDDAQRRAVLGGALRAWCRWDELS
jgi:L-fuconolactonase